MFTSEVRLLYPDRGAGSRGWRRGADPCRPRRAQRSEVLDDETEEGKETVLTPLEKEVDD